MQDWQHKERYWGEYSQDDYEGSKVKVQDERQIGGYDADSYFVKNTNYRDFDKWLDMQCKGGWEVLKISRSFTNRETWCVFRRKIL